MAAGTAPILIAPKKDVTNSERLGSRMATRCSISTPNAARVLPTWFTRRCSSANVTRSVSEMYAGRSPCPAATAPSTYSTATFSMLGTSTWGDVSTGAWPMAVPLLSVRFLVLELSAAAGGPGDPRGLGRTSRRLGSARRRAGRPDGHRFDLDQELRFHEPGDDEERVGWKDTVGEVAREDLRPRLHEAVDVGGMGEKRLKADHVDHTGSCRGQHGAHVLEGLLRLGHDVTAPDHVAGAIRTHLPRHHHELSGRRGHAVGVHAERGAELLRRDRLRGHGAPSRA